MSHAKRERSDYFYEQTMPAKKKKERASPPVAKGSSRIVLHHIALHPTTNPAGPALTFVMSGLNPSSSAGTPNSASFAS